MEEFEKIDWVPNVEDIIDDKFVNEERLQQESAMYQNMNGVFYDPFQDIRIHFFKPKNGPINDQKKDIKKQKRRTNKKKKKQN